MLELKESRGTKHSTIVRYKELTTRIYPAIGHIKLKDLRADHLNTFYTELGKDGSGAGSSHATVKVDLVPLLKKNPSHGPLSVKRWSGSRSNGERLPISCLSQGVEEVKSWA